MMPVARDSEGVHWLLKQLGADDHPFEKFIPIPLKEAWPDNHPLGNTRKVDWHYQGWLYWLLWVADRTRDHGLEILETGVLWGASTMQLLAWPQPKFRELPSGLARVTSLEIDWKPGIREFLRTARNWKPVTTTSQVWMEDHPEALFDVFLHDSDHAYANQKYEYAWAWKHLRDGGLLATDDYVWDGGNAWKEFVEQYSLEFVTLGHMAVVVRK